jgi:hypothetical protein
MKVYLSDGTESTKAGGFNLEKHQDFSNVDIGRVTTQRMND